MRYGYDLSYSLKYSEVKIPKTKYLLYKTLDKWIFTEFPSVLKYLKVDNGSVKLVKSLDEKEKNDVSKDSEKDLEAKSDWIEENILNEEKMREVLIRIMRELGLKWYELPHRETLIRDVVEKYIKKKLKQRFE